MSHIEDLFPPPPTGQIEIGTVGWADADDWFEVGAVGEDTGYTMVRVQLYRGKQAGTPVKAGIGQGYKMLCHIASNIGRIPPKGTRCYVAVPHGYDGLVGAGVIIATVEKNNVDQLKQGRAVLDYGDDELLIKAKSITLQSTTGAVTLVTTVDGTKNGKLVAFKVYKDGFRFASPYGGSVLDKSGYHLKVPVGSGQARLDMGQVTVPGLGSIPLIGTLIGALTGYATLSAPTVKIDSPIVQLGPGPYNSAVHAPSANRIPPLAGTPINYGPASQSATVWITQP